MELRRDIQKKIDRKRQEIQDLHVKLKETESYVQALEDTLKMLPRDGANDGGAEKFLRAGSNLALARDAIRDAGRPLHVKEILTALGRPLDRPNRAGLSGSIGAYVRKGEIFTRPAPNTYGLVELTQASEPTGGEDGPPAGFGTDDD